jgi:hypothetical protein
MATVVEVLMDTAKADTDVLIKNDELGDVLSIPREVDFLLRAPSEEKATLVADFINDNRYGDATALCDEEGYRVSVLINMPITQHVLCSVSGLMACICEIFEIEYDGWESAVQKGTAETEQ